MLVLPDRDGADTSAAGGGRQTEIQIETESELLRSRRVARAVMPASKLIKASSSARELLETAR